MKSSHEDNTYEVGIHPETMRISIRQPFAERNSSFTLEDDGAAAGRFLKQLNELCGGTDCQPDYGITVRFRLTVSLPNVTAVWKLSNIKMVLGVYDNQTRWHGPQSFRRFKYLRTAVKLMKILTKLLKSKSNVDRHTWFDQAAGILQWGINAYSMSRIKKECSTEVLVATCGNLPSLV